MCPNADRLESGNDPDPLHNSKAPVKLADTYAVWKSPLFRNMMLGQILFQLGTNAQGLAIGWEIYSRTNDPLALGLVALTKGLPMILFTLPAGYLADAFDRKRIIVLSLTGATLTSLVLALLSWQTGSITLMYVALFLDSTCARIGGPSGSAIAPLLIPRNQFESSIKWRTNLFHFTSLAGPALGGMIIAINLQAAYVFCAATSVIFILMIAGMKIPDAPRARPGKMLTQVFEGIQFVWRRKIVLGAVSLDLFAVLFGGAVYLLPVFAKDILTVRPFGMSPEQSLGWLLAAPSAGALVMGLLLAHAPPIKKAGRALYLGVFAFGVATIVFGFSRNFWLSWAMLFLTGFFDTISVVIRHTLVQLVTPNEMRGRVSSVNAIFIGSSNELGGFESGLVARWVSPVFSVISGGVATLIIVLGWTKLFPRLRHFGSLSDIGEHDGH